MVAWQANKLTGCMRQLLMADHAGTALVFDLAVATRHSPSPSNHPRHHPSLLYGKSCRSKVYLEYKGQQECGQGTSNRQWQRHNANRVAADDTFVAHFRAHNDRVAGRHNKKQN
eukprot:CAMPEP_0198349166 /NCGR_PEP_ID=MMETSP1450-20131203/92816_1 /TAXON_ID=753684 ORGANISM="Madagascaria erythrocladiodes, Strain CCMP3234" /NCGR_SAMPLE_ID=MMETSP1450 /ASSEMBLY_ACC=CAM_ASM_001115 /LENGTH=113 /DNA_ID=CAMNT_0044054827 /DNA_START=132 /DNA_END=470 /DNA_ORIENTATION=+